LNRVSYVNFYSDVTITRIVFSNAVTVGFRTDNHRYLGSLAGVNVGAEVSRVPEPAPMLPVVGLILGGGLILRKYSLQKSDDGTQTSE